MQEFLDKSGDDLPAGALIGVRLLPPGQTPRNPLEFSPEAAAAEIADLQKRHGIQE